MSFRVRVDEGCEGHGNCYATCPEVFELNEEGYARGLDRAVPDELVSQVQLAVSRCPENAIVLEETSDAIAGN